MIRGSCLCGGIRFRIAGKLYGCALLSWLDVPEGVGQRLSRPRTVKAAEFEFVRGAELVTFYQSSPANHRGFCRVCGSPIISKFDAHPKYYGLPLGVLDDDPEIRPTHHVHVASKAPWLTITDDLPQLPEGPE
jgi:hypothetical protein